MTARRVSGRVARRIASFLLYTFGLDAAAFGALRPAAPPPSRTSLDVYSGATAWPTARARTESLVTQFGPASGEEEQEPASGRRSGETALASFEVVATGFSEPAGVAVDAAGAIYVADTKAGTLTRIVPGGGKAVVRSRLEDPMGLAFDGEGGLLIVERKSGRLLRWQPSGALTVVASGMKKPRWVAVGEEGTVYLSAQKLASGASDHDVLLRMTPHGSLSVFSEGFSGLSGITTRGRSVYAVTERLQGEGDSGGTTLVRVPVHEDGSAGSHETLLRGHVQDPVGVVLDRLGGVFLTAQRRHPHEGGEDDGDDDAEQAERGLVLKRLPNGRFVSFARTFHRPRGMAFEASGHLLLAHGHGGGGDDDEGGGDDDDEGAPRGRLIRFRAPEELTVATPAFTKDSPVDVGGTTLPGNEVGAYRGEDFAAALASTVADGVGGAFALAVPLLPNQANDLTFVSTGSGGDGLTGAPVVRTVVHDDVAPAVAVRAPAEGSHTRGLVTLRAEATDERSGVESLRFSLDGSGVATHVNPDPTQPFEATAEVETRGLPDGDRALDAAAKDRAGNVGLALRSFFSDNTPPETEITAGPSGTTSERSPVFTLAGSDALTPASELVYAFRLDGGPWSAFSPETTLRLSDLADGTHVFEAAAQDLAGNADPSPARRDFSVSSKPTVSIADATVVEGHGSAALAALTVSLSGPSAVPVTVDYLTTDGTATSCDYAARFGTLTFAPGAVAQTISVPVFGELLVEPNETVIVQIGNPSQATLGDGSATLTITDDDVANAAPAAPTNLQPANGASDVVFTPTLSWSSFDLDPGDAVVHDVYVGAQFGLTGQSWNRLCAATSGPSPRSAAATAYDDARDRLIVFGGKPASGASLGDVWVLEHATGAGGAPRWTALAPTGTAPSARRHASGVYDAAANRLIVHGGCGGTCETALADTWALLNANGLGGTPEWTLLPDAPVGRTGHAAAWDASRGAMLVFGGSNGVADRDDVWVLRDASGASPAWEERATGVRPAARKEHVAGYDAAGDRLIVFGGRLSDDTPLADSWVLQNAVLGTLQWVETTPGTPGPPARYGHASGYDPASKRLLVFGGTNAGVASNLNFVMSDAWLLTNADGSADSEWVRVEPGADLPAGRFSASAGYSPSLNRLAVALGANDKPGAPILDDLWSLNDAAGSLPLVSEGQAAATFQPGTLAAGTTYFWKVVAEDSHGARAASPASRFTANHPAVSAAAASVAEGDAGETPLVFTVTLSRASDVETSAGYQTADGSAVSGQDFTAVSGTLVFPANTTSASVTVNVTGETTFEPDETFTLVLSNPQRLVLGTSTATGTILNDDPVPNMAPVVDAGPAQTIQLPASKSLQGTVTDDGLPAGASLSLLWSVVSGAGSVTFSSPTTAATLASFNSPGPYRLRLTASDTELSGLGEVEVTAEPAPNLVAGTVDDSGLVVDGQTLAASGTLSMSVSSSSSTAVASAFTVTFFEDRNGDAQFQPGVDNVLGTAQSSSVPAGVTVTVQANASGTMLFTGNVVFGLVDSAGVIAESNEADNLGSSAPCVTPPPPSYGATALKWYYRADKGVTSTPMVADLDGDHVPEVIFVDGSGRLNAVHGRDGSPYFVVTDPAGLINLGQVAVGDLDGDGSLPEIVLQGGNAQLLAFEHDGVRRWISPILNIGAAAGGPAIANLDGLGRPEIVFGNKALDANGNVLWTCGAPGNNGDGPLSIVANLDMAGGLEVIGGGSACRADGTPWWTALGGGFAGVGNFDADPFPEIAVALSGNVWLLEHTGATKWGPVFTESASKPAGTMVADVDGDGIPEIGVAGRTKLLILKANGSVLWEAAVQDISSGGTSPVAFDFDGDGKAEVIHEDELKLRIFRGIDGALLFEFPLGNGTRLEEPVIADVDADGHADILAVANSSTPDNFGVWAFSNPGWVGARPVWNQHSYHVTNVNDDGSIPVQEAPSWAAPQRGYRQQAIVPASPTCVFARPDLVASNLRLSSTASARILTARIGNGGNAATLAATPVSFYDGDPRTGGQRIGFLEAAAPLLAGQFRDVELHLPLTASTEGSIFVVADDAGNLNGQIVESDETNNVYDSGLALVTSPGQADLAVASIETSGLVMDPQSLAVSGTLSADVRNLGEAGVGAAFTVTFFEDLDGDETLSAGDSILGSARPAGLAAGASLAVSVSVSSSLRFRDAPIHAFADSAFEVAESTELNNVYRSGAACAAAPPGAPYSPQVEWSWTTSSRVPAADQVTGVPALIDLDGDGLPEVVFSSYSGGAVGAVGPLRAVRGTDGSEVFTASAAQITNGSGIAVGNIDADPQPEIVAVSQGNRLVAYEHNNVLKWTSPLLQAISSGGPAIADLNGDGTPEIVVGRQVLSASGALLRTGTAGSGSACLGALSIVADLDLDGVPEIVAGNTAYRTTGPAGQLPVFWQNTAVADGPTAIANFDADPNPEIVVVGSGSIWMLEHTGALKWGPVLLPGQLGCGVPAIADFDGNGRLDISVGNQANGSNVAVYDGRGFMRWRRNFPLQQSSFIGPLSASAFDFDGDGAAEVVHGDTRALRILRGSDGATLYETLLGRLGAPAYPIVADVDGDGNAEIVTAVSGPAGTPHGLYALGDAQDRWVGARRLWNQHSYHVTNVNDDGTIPAHEPWDPLNFNSYRRSGLLTGFPLAAPDLTASYARLQPSGSNLLLTLRVGNAGAGVAPPGVQVSFWDGPPGTALLGTVSTTQTLAPGEHQDVTLTLAGDATSSSTIHARVDETGSPNGPNFECREANNVLDTGLELNQKPQVSAGANQVISLPQDSTTLIGSVTDDGLPVGGTLTQSWSLVSGPGTVTFGTPNATTTTATFIATGTYVLRLTATDTRLTESDDVEVRLTEQNQPPEVSAGADQTITLPPQSSVTLSGSVTDDDLPMGASVSVAWSQVSGPAPVTFSAPTSLTIEVSFTIHGTYVLRLTADDTALSQADDVTITVNQGNTPPQVSAGADQTITLPTTSTTLNGSASDDGLPVGSSLSVSWSQVSGPGVATLATPTAASTSVSFDAPGSYGLRLTATDGALSASDDVTVTVETGPPVGDAPVVTLTSPTEGDAVTAPTDITGSVQSASLLSWKLQVRRAGDTDFTTIQTGNTPVTGTLTTFDPTLLLNGQYELQFKATDTAGRSSTTGFNAVVKENLKVGNFTVSFTDLEVPLAGMPIRVTRTYDSRDKQSADFGFGWRLEVSNVKLQENGIAGNLWFGSKGPGFLPQYCLQPTKPVIVTVTTPDGRVHEFQPNLLPTCVSGAPPNSVIYGFQPRPGTTTDSSLRVAGNDHVIAVGSWPGPMQLYDDGTYQIFDPDTYILSFPDGREFTVHQTTGLKQIKDLNNNILTVNQNGITHSTGVGIVIARDGQGRVTSVTDPDNNAITYGFDPSGDLQSVTDREDKETTFTYFPLSPGGGEGGGEGTSSHLLDEIRDPLGRTPIKNEYDGSGRLIRHTDAFGKTIEYTHNIGTRQEIVKDRNDKVRVLEYDERGNVVKEIQPDGRQILRTFDGRNNRTSETEPHETTNTTPATTTYVYDNIDNLLSVTDPNNNTTEYTYNAKKQVLTTKDPRGKFTVNAYDVKGNLTSTKSGGVTATGPFQSEQGYTYDAQGNVATQTVTVGGVSQTTSYLYTGQGHLFRETDANGHVTDYAPSFFGNRLSETTTRTTYACSAGNCTPSGTGTLIRSYEYDKNNRLTKTTDPDGGFTRTVYDAMGRQKETYDKLNRKTEFTYDDMGRLTKTTYPDLTTDESTYDPEGRRLTSKDRANRTTTYLYDDLGRLIKTTFPDTTFAENFYDAAGRLTSTKDGRGKITTYEYDSSGRRTKVKDPLNNETVFTYDVNGNQKTIKDARLNTTTYDYDDLNRRTKTTFPDTTFTETTYDELSRRTSEKDQAGKVTQFQYDKLSRLTKVIDALLQETTYGYDELGNRIRETDANGRSTWFVFDKLGREIQRHLPDGSTESKTYDPAGNLQTRTDFMGRVTTYDYDDNNRLTTRTYPNAAENVSFTYTSTGRRLTAVDARGTTSYGYDLRDRLISMETPLSPGGGEGQGEGILGYTYDGNGNRTSLTATIGANSHTTTYSYDDASRLDIVTDPAPRTYDHGYDPNGNRTSLAYPNGTNTSYVYNSLNRLTSLTTTGPLGTVFSQAFTLGPSGNRTQVVENDGTTKDYSYDSLYRLTQDKVSDTIGLVYQKDFTYDAVGNRQQQTTVGTGLPGTPTAPGTISYTYDTRDRLLTDAASYGHDANGNLTSKSGEATYTWDHENRLINVSKADGTTVSYVYDVDGNRVRTTTTPSGSSATVVNNLVDTSGGLSHVVAETDAGTPTPTLTALYVRNADDLLCVMRPAGGGLWNSRFFHADGIGSIRRLTNEAGTITDGYSYTAFGEQIAHTGSDPQPYSFAGEPLDPNSGFQYHRARWMDPRAARFLAMDPWRGGLLEPMSLHRYLYAAADPIDQVDPTGLTSLAEANFTAGLGSSIRAQSVISPQAARLAVNRSLGKALESAIERLILREFPTAVVRTQRALTGPGGTRIYDLLVKIGDRLVIIESKTNLPGAGSAFRRLIGQVRTFSTAAEAEAQGAQVIVYSEAATESALARVLTTLGAETTPQFVQGMSELLSVLRGILIGI